MVKPYKDISHYDKIETLQSRFIERDSMIDRLLLTDRKNLLMLLMQEFGILSTEHIQLVGLATVNSMTRFVHSLTESSLIIAVAGTRDRGESKKYRLTKRGHAHLDANFNLSKLFGEDRSGYKDIRANVSLSHKLNVTQVLLLMMANPNVAHFSYDLEYEIMPESKRNRFGEKAEVSFRVDARIFANGKEVWLEQDNNTEGKAKLKDKMKRLSTYATDGVIILYTLSTPLNLSEMQSIGKKISSKGKSTLKSIEDIYFHYSLLYRYGSEEEDFIVARKNFNNLIEEVEAYQKADNIPSATKKKIKLAVKGFNQLKKRYQEKHNRTLNSLSSLQTFIKEQYEYYETEIEHDKHLAILSRFIKRATTLYECLEALKDIKLYGDLLLTTELVVLSNQFIEVGLMNDLFGYYTELPVEDIKHQAASKYFESAGVYSFKKTNSVNHQNGGLSDFYIRDVYLPPDEAADTRPVIVFNAFGVISDRLRLKALLKSQIGSFVAIIITTSGQEKQIVKEIGSSIDDDALNRTIMTVEVDELR